MVTVYTTSDPKQVALLEMALRDAGLEFRVDNEMAAMAMGPIPAVSIEIQVRDQDAAAAKKAIQEALTKMK